MLLSPMKPVLPGPMPHLDHVCTSAALPQASGVFPSSTLHMPPSKRPKLSLQTSQLPTSYASSASSTSNNVANLATTTPTTLNTFTNTFDLSIRPSPNSATTSPASFHLRTKAAASPLRRSQPYSLNLPLGVRPILKNSGIAKDYRRGSLTASASPRTSRRVFFPPAKKVSFQAIDEEIITHTYIARDIDLSCSEDEQANTGAEKDEPAEQDIAIPSTESTSEVADAEGCVTAPIKERYRSPEMESRGRRRRQHSISGLRLVKKKRRWEWTLSESEDRDLANKDTLTPVTPSQISVSNVDAVERGVVEDRQTPEASQEDQAVDNTNELNNDTDATAQETSVDITVSAQDDLHPLPSLMLLPSSPQSQTPSVVKALVKIFSGGS